MEINSDPSTQDELHNQPESQPWDTRNGFSGWFMGLGWSITSFVLFQLIAGLVAIALLIYYGKLDLTQFSERALFENLDIVFIGNTFGQILFLGFMTWVVTRLSTSKHKRVEFLRLNKPANTARNLILAFALLVAAQPIIYFLSWLNMQLPFSESYLNFEKDQMNMIKNFLTGEHILLITLFHIAVVPAICEEILFRGYILRNFERSMLPITAIILSGVIFGLFHVRFTQFIPLATIGMVLAWLTIVTKSIWPAVIAHFVNNAGSVIFATYFSDIAFDESLTNSMPPLPLLLLGIFLTGFLLYYIRKVNIQSEESESYVQRIQSG
jgi:membrane protease YdiL (CAAX protease family)